jgi:hypothetical protein
MSEKLTDEVKALLKDAAAKLTGPDKRNFMAKTARTFFDGSARKAETCMGWNRLTIELGLHELRTGIICLDNYHARGNKKTEVKLGTLEPDIRSLVDEHSQADPQMKNTFAYARITAEAVRKSLLEEKGYREEQLPTVRTISALLNRLDYRLRKVQKTKPQKKVPETDAIFANLREANQQADANPQSLRISVDTKATVAVGDYSRDGKSRGQEAVEALDHDMQAKTKLIPVGILNTKTAELSITFGSSHKTSDLIADCVAEWWARNESSNPNVMELVINHDNGPESNSHRTQFMSRMVSFAQTTGLRIRLVYYPPYHSKYNPIERCWAALENHWNGALLSTVETVIDWAKTMTWKGIVPVVTLSNKVYAKGVRLSKKAMSKVERMIQRSKDLPKWDVVIEPQAAV